MLRAPQARHTRVASTPRGIFFVIIIMRIFLSNSFSKFFFPNFLVKIFNKIFSQNFFSKFFFQNFSRKFSLKFFRDLFRRFRTRDTRVLRSSHARHTRVASTPRGIFLVIMSMRIFLSNIFSKFFFEIFFVKIFLKIFSQNFFSNFFSKFFVKIFF